MSLAMMYDDPEQNTEFEEFLAQEEGIVLSEREVAPDVILFQRRINSNPFLMKTTSNKTNVSIPIEDKSFSEPFSFSPSNKDVSINTPKKNNEEPIFIEFQNKKVSK